MYNPSKAGVKGSIFGLPYGLEESDMIILPVHLDVTVSYGQGTSRAPDIILDESSQLDLSLLSIEKPWKLKMAMYDRLVINTQNEIHRGRAINVIKAIESGKKPDLDQLEFVNEFCDSVHKKIEEVVTSLLRLDKIVCVIGGDHSSPLGLMRALAKKGSYGILQIDAHMDLRNAYEEFKYSHASIMNNALKEEGITSLTQIGIRDFCEEEEDYVNRSKKPIHVFYDEDIFKNELEGISWKKQVCDIIKTLPDDVYVSFDMDGLDPSLCPNTGTPVVGGLQFNQVIYLLEQVVRSGKKIIGFDVCEAGNHPWDANVAARVIYRLAALTGVSAKLIDFK
ncbi:agmatinase family protein [Ekhidna sp.]